MIVNGLENFHHDSIISCVSLKSQPRFCFLQLSRISYFQYIGNSNLVDRSLSTFLLLFFFLTLHSQNKILIIFWFSGRIIVVILIENIFTQTTKKTPIGFQRLNQFCEFFHNSQTPCFYIRFNHRQKQNI